MTIGPQGPIGPPGPIGPRQTTIRFAVAYGSFTETGKAAVFQVQQHETERGYTLTGEAALFKPSILSARGSFVETGEAALFRVGMVEAVGSLVETGEAAILTPAVVATYGSFVETGEDAFLIDRGNVNLETLQIPINCVLYSQQLIKDRYRENNLFDPNIKSNTRQINGVSVQLDITGKFKKPSFTVTQNSRGYD